MSTKEWIKESEEVDVLDEILSDKKLIVHNDEINTFDWVIKALIEICEHSPEQAEQCTLLVHYKGKCTVKSGEFDILRPMREGLTDRGIGATIE
jgi:ATP-dependent Clp protease adaptor protein ClpS